MNQPPARIGFSSQRIRYAWLERTARMLLAGMSPGDIVQALRMELQMLSGDDPRRRSSREKAITMLCRVWVRPDRRLVPLRDAGLALLAELPCAQHQAVHWGMMMAAYPFWGAVAAEVGRLLRLQGRVATAQVRRRLYERYGQRDVVARATQTVLRSFVDWGVLVEASQKGDYIAPDPYRINNTGLVAWLVEACLHTNSQGSVNLRTTLNSPSLFPFRLMSISGKCLTDASGRVDMIQDGTGEEWIICPSFDTSEKLR